MVVQRYRKPQVARSIRVTSSNEKPLRIDVLSGFCIFVNIIQSLFPEPSGCHPIFFLKGTVEIRQIFKSTCRTNVQNIGIS